MATKLTRRDLRELARVVTKQGWVVDRTHGGHIRFTAPNGDTVFAAQTPSDHRAVKNIRSRLRQRGAVL